MEPKIFGWQHLTYDAVCIVLIVAALVCIKLFVKKEKTLTIITKIIAGLLLATVVANRISVRIKDQSNLWHLLPSTWCSVCSFTCALSTLFLKKDNKVIQVAGFVGIIGGALTMIYPDFIGQNISFFYIPTITGLLHHTLMVFLVILLIMTKQLVFDLKHWKEFLLGLCIMMVYGIFLNDVLGFVGAMEISKEFISGTGLTWFTVGLMVISLYMIICTGIYFYKKKKSTKVQNQVEEETK